MKIDFSLSANPDITHINKEPDRSWFLPYSCRCNALSGARILNGHTSESAYAGIICEKNTRRKLLNGDWGFIPCSSEDEIIQTINSTEGNTTIPNKIKVPGNNNAGVYKREFSFPAAWTGRDVLINFDGASGFFYIYINDEFAGASRATFSPAEFNITPLLKAGKNTVTVIVFNQDTDNAKGIFRDVYLLARSHDHIKDIQIKTDFDTIQIDVFASKKNGAATVELYDDNNQLLTRKDSVIKDSKASFEIKIENPINWTPEKPYLYTALIHGFNEVIPQRVALRTTTLSSAVTLKSIDDTFFDESWPLRIIINELLLLKKHNINCLKIHKNNATAALLNLCEEIGFIVNYTTENSCARRNDRSDLPVLSAAYSPISAKAHEMTFTKQTYAFTNNTDFTNLEEFDIAYTIKTPSKAFAQGVLNINCAPHQTVCESIDFTFPEFSFEEFFIEFKYKLKKDTVWAQAGLVTGFNQIKLPVLQTIPETETTSSMPPMSVHFSDSNEKGIMTVEGEDFTYSFDMTAGTFTSILFNDIEMIKSSPKFTIDNTSNQQPLFCRILSKGSKYVTILASYSICAPTLATSVNFSVLWAIYGSGEIGVCVTTDVAAETPTLTRFGFEMKMPEDNNFAKYYGFGPFATYYNSKDHCKKGIYQENLAGKTTNHFGTQWAIVHDFEGRGILFKGMPDFQFGTLDDTIRIDYKQTDIDDKQFLYSFTLKPLFTECTDILRESRTLPRITEV